MMNLLHYQSKHGNEPSKQMILKFSESPKGKREEPSKSLSPDHLEIPTSYINNLSASISASVSAMKTTPTGSNATGGLVELSCDEDFPQRDYKCGGNQSASRV